MKTKIDIHTHCLPNVDDGARTIEESLAMLSESFLQGVEICAATPHCTIHKNADVERFLAKRQSGFDKIKDLLDENKHPKVILGAEIFLDNDINRYDNVEKLCLENTDCIMLEFPIGKAKSEWSEWIYNLNRKDLRVVVAHVDRYPEWEKMMDDFSGLDVIYQVNASRFTDFWSGGLLKKLMKRNNKYIISSDMHNLTTRKCNMNEAYEKAKRKYPSDADLLFGLNAKKHLGL